MTEKKICYWCGSANLHSNDGCTSCTREPVRWAIGEAKFAPEEQRPCALGMCIFVADEGSKWCRHHRNIEERYEAKQRAAIAKAEGN